MNTAMKGLLIVIVIVGVALTLYFTMSMNPKEESETELSAAADQEAAVMMFEAESAAFSSPVKVMKSPKGFSGTGFVARFEEPDDYITFSVDAPEEGLYRLHVGYGALYGEGKVVNFAVNEQSIGSFSLEKEGFNEVGAGNILLNKGSNTITLTPNWTWFAIDYIKLVPAEGPKKHEVSKELINPKATKQAKALMSYLVDNFGEKIISGQQEYPNKTLAETKYIFEVTEKNPAVLGLDFIDNSPSRVERGTKADEVKVAIDWVKNRGGIVALMWHWNAPKELIDEPGNEWWAGFYTRATTFDLEYAMDHPDSDDYKLLVRDIDVISAELNRLQDAEVPVLWRPLHEAEGGWFWWGAKGPEPVKKLWKMMYDRMTNHHKLNNLIWVWNSIDPAWYPGNEYVDIVSFDSYPGAHNYGPMSSQYEKLVELSGYNKIIAMAENGPIPDPDQLQIYNAMYSWFSTWNGGFLKDENSREHLKKVFNHDLVITLDELPDFMND